MPRHPAQFELLAVPVPPAVEAAARRRMRGLERSDPAIRQWDLRVDGLQGRSAPTGFFAARVEATIAGGERLRGEAGGADPLGALRLAFNALERELEAEHESARHRAAQWLMTVRRKLVQPQRPA